LKLTGKQDTVERSKNSWQLQIYTGKGPDGKQHRHFEAVRGRKGDAQRRLTELLVSLDRGIYTPPGKLTIADLLNQFLRGYVKTKCSQRTQDGYQIIAERHLIPAPGHILLKQVTPQAIQAYYGKACEKLSSRTVHKHHRLLKQSLKYGVRQGYLGRNPCDLVNPPSWKARAMRTLTPEESKTLLEIASVNQFYPVIYTAISSRA